jgi:excisionase family DNA binding protein
MESYWLLLTPEEAADRLGIGRTQLFALLRRGEILSISLGKSRRVPVVELERFVQREAAEAGAAELQPVA